MLFSSAAFVLMNDREGGFYFHSL